MTMARALLLNGTVGAGKTTTADAVGELLTAAGTPHAVMDLDALRRMRPTPPDDPWGGAVMLRNLMDVAANYRAAGAERLVMAGVLEDDEGRRLTAEAVGVPLTVCRLRVALPTVRERLLRRHDLDPDGLAWHLRRHTELHAVLEGAGVDDIVVDASHGTPAEIATRVLAATGWEFTGRRAADGTPCAGSAG